MSKKHSDSGIKPEIAQLYGRQTTKIGPRVREDLWEEFKVFSEIKYGKQGMASEELNAAMYNQMQGQEQRVTLEEVDRKLEMLLGLFEE